MAASATVRVTPETRERLARICAERGVSTPELITRLVDLAEADLLLEQMNGHYAELRGDHSAWSEFRSEGQAWEATLLDGLASGR